MKKTVVCMLIAAMTMGSMVLQYFADGKECYTHLCTDSSGRSWLDWFRSNIRKRKNRRSK